MKPYSAYKDSGIEWLGKMPEHWEVKRVKYLADVNRAALSERTDPEYEFYYVDIGNVTLGEISESISKIKFKNAPSRARRVLRKGDTIVSTVRTYLKAIAHFSLEGDEFIASTGFAVLSPKFIDEHYFAYLMMCEKVVDTISAMSVGVSYPAVNASDVANIPVWYPPDVEEQTAIADYLDRKIAQIDAVIAKKERLVELLREERAVVISQAISKGLNPDAPMKDSGVEWLGAIPENWEVKRLKWVIEGKLKYGANETSDLTDISLPRYIRITDFDEEGNLRDETFRAIEWEIAKDYLLEEGDVLFARSGATVGKTFQFKNYDGDACFAGYLIKAKPKRTILTSDYLYLYTQSNAYENWKNSIFIQATIQNIGADKYAILEITIPPLAEQVSIVKYLEQKTTEINQTITQNQMQIERLREYRTALISAVVTGKFDVCPEAAP